MSANQENLFALSELKGMTAVGLMKLMKALTAAIKTVTTELESKSKGIKIKGPKEDKVKGSTPPHLLKNNAWVTYAKKHALVNGWEAFIVHQKEGDVEMTASILREGVHIHEATGKPMIHKEAMSYAKHLWSAKTGTGAHKEIFEAFEEQYHEAPASAAASASASAAAAAAAAAAKPKKDKTEWKSLADGQVKAWSHEGVAYLRDNENRIWHEIQGGGVGAWKGIYNPLTDEMEEAEEPLYEDE